MSIQDSTSCNKKRVLFDNENVLDSKIDELTTDVSKFITQSKNKANHSNLKSVKEEGEVNDGLIIMTEMGSKAEIDQVVETDSEDHLTEVDLSMDKIPEEESSGE